MIIPQENYNRRLWRPKIKRPKIYTTIVPQTNQNDDFQDGLTTTGTLAYNGNTHGTTGTPTVLIAYLWPWAYPIGSFPVITATDTQSNTWKQQFQFNFIPSGDSDPADTKTNLVLWSFCTHSAANTVTFHLSEPVNMGIAIIELKGNWSNLGFFCTATSYSNSDTLPIASGTIHMPSYTPEYTSTIALAGIGMDGDPTGPGTGWTELDRNDHIELEYIIQTSKGAVVPTWDLTGGNGAQYQAFAFALHEGAPNNLGSAPLVGTDF